MEQLQQYLLFVIIGGVAGWLAGLIMKGGGFGIVGNIIVGIVGALLGGWLFKVAGISAGHDLVGSLFTAVVGAVILLFIIGFIKKKA